MLLRHFVRFRSLQPTQNPTSDFGVNIIELCKIIKILKRTYFGVLPSFVYFGSVKFPQMSDFSQSPELKYIRETRQFYKILWKNTGHFCPNNRTFRTFQNPDSQTWGSGYNSNTKPNIAIKLCKNRFQKCPKNYNCNFISNLFCSACHSTFFSAKKSSVILPSSLSI